MKTTGIVRVCYSLEPYAFIDAIVSLDVNAMSGAISHFWFYGNGIDEKVLTWDEAKALFHKVTGKEPR